MSNKIVKELIIIFLLLVVILFAIGILFYDSMTENVEDILATQYASSDAVNEVLQEIEENGGGSLKSNSSDSLLKSYSINAEDLSGYASENYYESGKKDPFAESSETIKEHTTTTVQTGTATKSQTGNPIDNAKKDTNTVSNNANEKKSTNTIENTINTNTVKNTTNTETKTSTNTTNSTSKDKTNTINSISNDKTNTVNNISKDKSESSSTGTFFEDKNSK